MQSQVKETILSALTDKIRGLEYRVKELERENTELRRISLPAVLGPLRLRQIVLVSFLDHDPTEELEDVLKPEEIRCERNSYLMHETEKHIFRLHRAPLSDEERAVFMRAFNHGLSNWW